MVKQENIRNEQAEGADQAGKELPFELGHWGEFVRWQCKYCPYDTLEGEAAAWEHYNQVHRPAEPTKPVNILLADRYGNPVEGG